MTIAIRPTSADRKTVITPVAFFFLSAAAYVVAAYIFGGFVRWLGIVMLLIFGAFVLLQVLIALKVI